MAWFGRESEADRQRAERVGAWIRARSPYAIVSPALGALAVIDCWTLLIGVAAGIGAIVTGVLGRQQIRRERELKGKLLCVLGIGLGLLGLGLSAVLALVVFPALST